MATRTTKKAVKKAAAKKAVKKAVAKKVTRTTPARKVVRPVQTTTEKVSEVFSTRPEAPDTVEVPPNTVLLYVNGNNQGQVDTTGQTIGDFVIAHAQRSGIRSFSVYLDGVKADTSDARKQLTGIGKVEIVAKDARG